MRYVFLSNILLHKQSQVTVFHLVYGGCFLRYWRSVVKLAFEQVGKCVGIVILLALKCPIPYEKSFARFMWNRFVAYLVSLFFKNII